jgi:sialic acid synthase SpsE
MKTKIILEVGYNHNGDIELAKDLIGAAKELKVWGVKFQKWDINGFPKELKKKVRNNPNDYGRTYEEHRKYLEFDIKQLKELKKYAEKLGLEFVCSGKDLVSLKQLVEMGCKWIKLPSQRYLDNDVFKYMYYARKEQDVKIMASTGMITGKQIVKSRWFAKDGADVLMHCISQYPAKEENVNLAWVSERYNGYSSHETEGRAIQYAVARGCEYIERHFTLDKTDKGSDHAISSDVKEMKRIIKEIEYVEKILGEKKRDIKKEEIELGLYYRSF